jgi:uncharacterized membrane protein HdeD (DUF308 family)
MKPHHTDRVSLLFGLLFVAVAGWWLLARSVNIALPIAGWLLAGGLIVFGLVALIGSLRPRRRIPGDGATSDDPEKW